MSAPEKLEPCGKLMSQDELDNLKWRRYIDNERGVAAPYGRAVDSLLSHIKAMSRPTPSPDPAELIRLHKDAVNACVSWKLGECTQDDAASAEAAFRTYVSALAPSHAKPEGRE